jgi:hypothetical protein
MMPQENVPNAHKITQLQYVIDWAGERCGISFVEESDYGADAWSGVWSAAICRSSFTECMDRLRVATSTTAMVGSR